MHSERWSVSPLENGCVKNFNRPQAPAIPMPSDPFPVLVAPNGMWYKLGGKLKGSTLLSRWDIWHEVTGSVRDIPSQI